MGSIYKEGTVDINHNSSTVNGTGTAWITAAVTSGAVFRLVGENALYYVQEVNGETQLTLEQIYLNKDSQNVTGADYTVVNEYNEGQYKTGKVSISSGSSYVSGFDTAWTSAGNIVSGSIFMAQGEKNLCFIDSITDDTNLVLSQPYYNKDVGRGLNTNQDKERGSYLVVRDYTRNYSWPLVVAGDKNWTHILTRSIRKIDEEFYTRTVKHMNIYDTPSGAFYPVSGGSYYQPHSSIKPVSGCTILCYDPYFDTFIYCDGSMASAAPSGSSGAPIWYPQWYAVSGA